MKLNSIVTTFVLVCAFSTIPFGAAGALAASYDGWYGGPLPPPVPAPDPVAPPPAVDPLPEPPATGSFVRGDSNGDGDVDISDAVFILDYLFRGGRAPRCPAAADFNGDRSIDISDAIVALRYLFQGHSNQTLGGPAVDASECSLQGGHPGFCFFC